MIKCGEVAVRGLLELFVLAECQRKPSSGKEMTDTAARLTDGNWRPSAGSVYPMLQKLEREGLIRSRLQRRSTGRREISYSITARGKRALEEGKGEMERSFKVVMTTINPIFIRIAAEFDEEDVLQAKRFWGSVMEMRSLILSQPRVKRKILAKKMFEVASGEIAKMKALMR